MLRLYTCRCLFIIDAKMQSLYYRARDKERQGTPRLLNYWTVSMEIEANMFDWPIIITCMPPHRLAQLSNNIELLCNTLVRRCRGVARNSRRRGSNPSRKNSWSFFGFRCSWAHCHVSLINTYNITIIHSSISLIILLDLDCHVIFTTHNSSQY